MIFLVGRWFWLEGGSPESNVCKAFEITSLSSAPSEYDSSCQDSYGGICMTLSDGKSNQLFTMACI